MELGIGGEFDLVIKFCLFLSMYMYGERYGQVHDSHPPKKIHSQTRVHVSIRYLPIREANLTLLSLALHSEIRANRIPLLEKKNETFIQKFEIQTEFGGRPRRINIPLLYLHYLRLHAKSYIKFLLYILSSIIVLWCE